jgi:hypothetical protein
VPFAFSIHSPIRVCASTVASALRARFYVCLTGLDPSSMKLNVVYAVLGLFVLATGVFGYELYTERHRDKGVEISIGDHGVSIEAK